MPAPNTSSTTSLVALTISQEMNALINVNGTAGEKWGGTIGSGTTLSYSFPAWTATSTPVFSGPNPSTPYSSLKEPTAAYHAGFNDIQQASAINAMQAWANVANITFTKVADTSTNVGDIRFAWTSATIKDGKGVNAAWGWTITPDSHPASADIWVSTADSSSANDPWSTGSFNFMSLIHEMGHALGLKHPFEDSPKLFTLADNRLYTIMSYTDEPQNMYPSYESVDGVLKWVNKQIISETPMVLDIEAIQYLYGANTTYNIGNDIYSFDIAKPFFKTLWDAAGNDTITAANFTSGCIIDLTPGSYSSLKYLPPANSGSVTPTYDGTNNLGIAYGCIIENAIGGSGNDTLTGNASNNQMTGGAGDDSINGSTGIDTSIYASSRAAYQLAKIEIGFTVSGGSDGADTLTGIERLLFTDKKIAIDLDGNAGKTAKILGAVFGASSITNKEYAGIGLSHLDGGMSYEALTALAIGVTGAATPQQVVNLLWTNVVGSAPSVDQAKPFIDMLTAGMTIGQLGVFAADTDLNQANINLVGLTQTGLEFI